MYIRRLTISNIRTIEAFELRFASNEKAGWHVILGANGAGKSSVVRSLALALAGPKEAAALRQNWNNWVRFGSDSGKIRLQAECGNRDVFTGTGRRTASVDVELSLLPIESSIGGPRFELVASSNGKLAERSIWGTNSGWFSASFGPFRRFTGGDQAYDRLFYSNPRLASHLSAFGEDVALTEGLRWLRELRVKQLEDNDDAGDLLSSLISFLNESRLLPHGARIVEVKSEDIFITDGDDVRVIVEQLSDGYRSVLSMIFEILRQMTKSFGPHEVRKALDMGGGSVALPGVVIIDEVDAHLHPSWQKQIGPWFRRCFPEIQFIVTTHSPIICQEASSVWRLPSPGTLEQGVKVEGTALNRLIHGSILDAYGTEFFGSGIARSDTSRAMLEEMANLNRKALRSDLSNSERLRLDELRRTLPTRASDTAPAL